MKWAIASVGVLFLPCAAKRIAHNIANHFVSDEDASSALQTGADESMPLFSTDAVAALEEMAADEQEQTQQFCTVASAMHNRTYHFELLYPDGDRTALELDRHPRDPKLRFYRGRTWSVRLLRTPDNVTGDIEESLEWTPVMPDSQGEPRLDEHGNMLVDASDPFVIDVRKDLAFIRRVLPVGETQAAIEFGLMNGGSQTFTGGLYYPETAMKRSLVRAFHEREREVRGREDSNAEVATLNRHAKGREMTVGGGDIALEGVAWIGDQLYQNAKISAIIAFSTTFFPSSPLSPFVEGGAWTTAVRGASWMTLESTVNALPFLVPMATLSAIHSWRHERRELSMTASEKLFEKFSCHRMIGVCEGAELMGRDRVFAFAGRPDKDVLVPFRGDVDVITQEPLPPVVGWRQRVNNPGNIECLDSRVLTP